MGDRSEDGGESVSGSSDGEIVEEVVWVPSGLNHLGLFRHWQRNVAKHGEC
jgi:hypothetical protein